MMLLFKNNKRAGLPLLAAAASLAVAFDVAPARRARRISSPYHIPSSSTFGKSTSSTSNTNLLADASSSSSSSPDDQFLDNIYESADAVFGMIDGDGNGVISYTELQSHLIDVCGYTQDAVDAMYYALDANFDGEISRDELRMGFVRYKNLREAPGMVGAGSGQQNSYSSESEIIKDVLDNEYEVAVLRTEAASMFDAIDKDNSGVIDNDELRSFLRERGYGDVAIDNIYATLDVNSDGEISREELTDAFVKFSALRRATGAESLSPGTIDDFELFDKDK